MPNSESPKNASNICLDCGLCCNGTLIGFVQLEQKEIAQLKPIMELETEDDQGFFLQPCSKFCDACTIYSDRPQSCRDFNCGLLQSVQSNEVEIDSALELIETIKNKRQAIEKSIELLPFDLQSKSFYFKVVELKNKLQHSQNRNELAAIPQDLISELEAIDKLLSKNFHLTLD